ncbi:MAG: VapC toxin family PIN domain ribonuclease [bacterium]|uniref:VapC toxin family PIN domain ribonuclease n=1 Tax=Candidatus Methylomirabilis tolerans TaxID=3123416 RepID=A0AAJ1EJE2_9BACT|nr:VapC toxin family PIN domain ribonuclease [Candidatus Methylomirabilis sp.]
MSKAVLDVFAPLTLLNQEDGAERVVPLLAETAISTVNLAEVTARLALAGMPEAAIRETPEPVPFDDEQAVQVGLFAPETKVSGLSLGDRACVSSSPSFWMRPPSRQITRRWALSVGRPSI